MKAPRYAPNQVDAFFDLETESWDRFVIGMLKTPGGKTFTRAYRDGVGERDFALALLSIKGVVWSFNGGRYDLLWVCDWIAKLGLRASIRATGQRIISIAVGETEFRDVCALVPFMSLGEAGKMAGRSKTATGLPCVCPSVASCGGYCSITRELGARSMATLTNYQEDDCDTGLAILDRLFSFGDTHKIEFAMTVGASAWRTAKSWSDLPAAKWAPSEYRQLREGYYGGRTQVFRPALARGYKCDINSAYPYALTKLALPVGERSYCGPSEAARDFARGREGIYQCEVDIPHETFLPPLPLRLTDRIAYPVGKFWGAWTALELRHAQDHGARLCQFAGAITFGETAPLLRPFCERVWALRADAQRRGDPIQKWLKTLGNAMTGKFAQKPDIETIEIIPNGRAQACPGTGKCAYQCSRKCGALRPIGRSSRVFTKPAYRMSPNAHVHWSAYLTAHARRQLHRQLLDGGDAAYCDTDSCFSRTRRAGLGDAIGEWKDEGRIFDFQALAPKTYSYIDEEGEFHGASKGIPDAARNFHRLRAGVKIDRGVYGLKTSARDDGKPLFRRKALTRQLRCDGKTFGDRILRDDGLTYPQDASKFFA